MRYYVGIDLDMVTVLNDRTKRHRRFVYNDAPDKVKAYLANLMRERGTIGIMFCHLTTVPVEVPGWSEVGMYFKYLFLGEGKKYERVNTLCGNFRIFHWVLVKDK